MIRPITNSSSAPDSAKDFSLAQHPHHWRCLHHYQVQVKMWSEVKYPHRHHILLRTQHPHTTHIQHFTRFPKKKNHNIAKLCFLSFAAHSTHRSVVVQEREAQHTVKKKHHRVNERKRKRKKFYSIFAFTIPWVINQIPSTPVSGVPWQLIFVQKRGGISDSHSPRLLLSLSLTFFSPFTISFFSEGYFCLHCSPFAIIVSVLVACLTLILSSCSYIYAQLALPTATAPIEKFWTEVFFRASSGSMSSMAMASVDGKIENNVGQTARERRGKSEITNVVGAGRLVMSK